MSREVFGDAPLSAALTDDSRAPSGLAIDVRPPPEEPPPAPRTRPRTRTLVSAALALTLVAGAAGWSLGGVPGTSDSEVSAAVLGAVQIASGDRPPRALVSIAVVNAGSRPIEVDGYVPDDEGFAAGANAVPHATVKAGEEFAVAVDVPLPCGDPTRLRMPQLLLRVPGNDPRPLTPAGGTAALVDVCEDLGPMIEAQRTSELSDQRLVVGLATRERKANRITAVTAGGVALDVGRLPTRISGIHSLVIAAPAECPAAWRQTGMPTRLTIQTDLGMGPAWVEVPVGVELVRWAMRTSCSAEAGS